MVFHDLEGILTVEEKAEKLSKTFQELGIRSSDVVQEEIKNYHDLQNEFNNSLAEFMGFGIYDAKKYNKIPTYGPFIYTKNPLPIDLHDRSPDDEEVITFMIGKSFEWDPSKILKQLMLCNETLMERGGYGKSSAESVYFSESNTSTLDSGLEDEKEEDFMHPFTMVILKYSKSETHRNLKVVAIGKNKYEAIKDACVKFMDQEDKLKYKL